MEAGRNAKAPEAKNLLDGKEQVDFRTGVGNMGAGRGKSRSNAHKPETAAGGKTKKLLGSQGAWLRVPVKMPEKVGWERDIKKTNPNANRKHKTTTTQRVEKIQKMENLVPQACCLTEPTGEAGGVMVVGDNAR